jgi:hypothetical protein
VKHIVSERTNLIVGVAFDLTIMAIALSLLVVELVK